MITFPYFIIRLLCYDIDIDRPVRQLIDQLQLDFHIPEPLIARLYLQPAGSKRDPLPGWLPGPLQIINAPVRHPHITDLQLLEQLRILPGRGAEITATIHLRLPARRRILHRMIARHCTILRTRHRYQRRIAVRLAFRQQQLTRNISEIIRQIAQHGVDRIRK